MEKVAVLVVVDKSANLARVRQLCEQHGLSEVRTVPGLRILRGLAEPDQMNEFLRIPGVNSVERERNIKLPPPRSRVQ